jgi:hypothetical protein
MPTRLPPRAHADVQLGFWRCAFETASFRPLTWGPFWDHTLCAMVNDLRVCARLVWPQTDRALVVTCGNACRYFLGVKWSQVQILSARRPKPALTSVGAGFYVASVPC